MKTLLTDLPLFVEVARRKSFTLAAEILDIPDSTLSRRISALEKELGVRLLNRNSRSVELTEPGREFFEHCEAIVTEAEAAREAVLGSAASPSGQVRISLRNDIYLAYLDAAFLDFARRWPDIRIRTVFNSSWVDLLTDPYDLDIRVGSEMPDSSLVARRLGQARPALYAAPALLAGRPAPGRPADLAQIPAVTVASAGEQLSLSREGRSEAVKLRVAHQFTCGCACLEFALAGLGLTLLSPRQAEPHLKSGALVRLLADWSLPAEDVYLVSASSRVPKRVRLFMEHLFEYSSRPGVWD